MGTLDTLIRYVEGAPVAMPEGPPNADLLGFVVGPEGLFVCSTCSGRIFGRGLRLPEPSWPIWDDGTEIYRPTCVLAVPLGFNHPVRQGVDTIRELRPDTQAAAMQQKGVG